MEIWKIEKKWLSRHKWFKRKMPALSIGERLSEKGLGRAQRQQRDYCSGRRNVLWGSGRRKERKRGKEERGGEKKGEKKQLCFHVPFWCLLVLQCNDCHWLDWAGQPTMTERGAFLVRKEGSGASRNSKKKKRKEKGGAGLQKLWITEEGGVCVMLII